MELYLCTRYWCFTNTTCTFGIIFCCRHTLHSFITLIKKILFSWGLSVQVRTLLLVSVDDVTVFHANVRLHSWRALAEQDDPRASGPSVHGCGGKRVNQITLPFHNNIIRKQWMGGGGGGKTGFAQECEGACDVTVWTYNARLGGQLSKGGANAPQMDVFAIMLSCNCYIYKYTILCWITCTCISVEFVYVTIYRSLLSVLMTKIIKNS